MSVYIVVLRARFPKGSVCLWAHIQGSQRVPFVYGLICKVPNGFAFVYARFPKGSVCLWTHIQGSQRVPFVYGLIYKVPKGFRLFMGSYARFPMASHLFMQGSKGFRLFMDSYTRFPKGSVCLWGSYTRFPKGFFNKITCIQCPCFTFCIRFLHRLQNVCTIVFTVLCGHWMSLYPLFSQVFSDIQQTSDQGLKHILRIR